MMSIKVELFVNQSETGVYWFYNYNFDCILLRVDACPKVFLFKIRSKPPYHFEDYQKETDFQKISSKKMRLGAYSIQDRYLIKNTARTKSKTSLNV